MLRSGISSVFFYAQVAEWRDNDGGCVMRLQNRGDRLQMTVSRLLTLRCCEIDNKLIDKIIDIIIDKKIDNKLILIIV